jgi:hypothetical protein
MNKDIIIFGARAKVYLKCDDDMQSLAKRLSEGLLLPEIYFDTDEDEPHEEFGSCEALGFEMWLRSSDLKAFSYLFEIATEHSFKEIFEDRMHDLSPWLARFIAEICDIESYIIDQQTQEPIKFIKQDPDKE